MKIILKEDIEKLGAAGDLVEVKDGYGRNYLIPQAKAVLATKGAIAEVELMKKTCSAKSGTNCSRSQRIGYTDRSYFINYFCNYR